MRVTTARKRTTDARQRIDPLTHALPGTALHRLSALVQSAAPGSSRRTAGGEEYLHIRNPLQVAEELEQRIVALGEVARRRVAAKVCPTLPLPRMLPLAVVGFVAGIALLATQRYWTAPLVAYGIAALGHNALVRVTVDRVVQAKAKQSRLLKVADSTLLVTTARLLFLADGRTSELELDRIVRVDVADEVRLTVTPSKREAPGIYFTLGHAHELAEVIRLARENL